MGRLVYCCMSECGLIWRLSYMCDIFRNMLLRFSFFFYLLTGSAFRVFSQLHGISACHHQLFLGSSCLPSDSCSASAWCSAWLDYSTCCLSLERGKWAGSERKVTSTGTFNGFSQITWVIMDTNNIIFTILCCSKGTWQEWRMWMQQIQATPTWATAWWWTVAAAAPGSLCTAGPGIMVIPMNYWTFSKWEISTASQSSWRSNQVRRKNSKK